MFIDKKPSYNFSWHNAPWRQYIVNLDADVEITVSSGETKVIRQGEVRCSLNSLAGQTSGPRDYSL